jgi:hypothetical protein
MSLDKALSNLLKEFLAVKIFYSVVKLIKDLSIKYMLTRSLVTGMQILLYLSKGT